MPGCLDKKNGCTQKHHKPYYVSIVPVLFRIICWGTWQLQWAKGLLGPFGKIPKHKIMCSLGPLGSCNGQRGGRVACPHQECTNTLTCSVKGWWWPPAIQQTLITCRFHHMLFTYCKHGLCLKCIHTIPSPRLYCISVCLY